MKISRWLSVVLMMGLILALSPLDVQAEQCPPFGPHPKYHHPRGNAHGWHGQRHDALNRHQKYFRHSGRGPHHPPHCAHHAGPPSVAYVTPVAPIIGIPYSQPQPFSSQPAIPGLSGNLNWKF